VCLVDGELARRSRTSTVRTAREDLARAEGALAIASTYLSPADNTTVDDAERAAEEELLRTLCASSHAPGVFEPADGVVKGAVSAFIELDEGSVNNAPPGCDRTTRGADGSRASTLMTGTRTTSTPRTRAPTTPPPTRTPPPRGTTMTMTRASSAAKRGPPSR
jgi:hypothetical protein